MNKIIIKLQQKNWMVYLGLGLAFLLIFSAALRLLTPSQEIYTEKINQNLDGSISEFEEIVFIGEIPRFPESLTIHRAALTDYNSALLTDFQLNFNLKPTPASQVWSGPKHSLTNLVESNRLIITFDTVEPKSQATNTEDAINEANDFIDLYLNKFNLSPQRDLIKYYQNSPESINQVTQANAEIFIIPFTFSIDGIPVYYHNHNQGGAIFTFNSNNQILKIDLSSQAMVFQGQRKYNLLSIQDAVEKINQQSLGLIVGVGYNSPKLLGLEQIKSGQMDKVYLEYRVNPNDNLVIPYYRFVGELIDNKNNSFPGQLITPAIELEPTN